jgi:hypothetical protein
VEEEVPVAEAEMRYGLMIGKKLSALQAAVDPLYRVIMLLLMVVEIGLLCWLITLEALHR